MLGELTMGVESGSCMEGTSLKWKRNQRICTEFLASGEWYEGY